MPAAAPTHRHDGADARAVVALLLSALAFSLMGVCVKQLVGRIPVAEIVLVRALLNLAMTGWMLRAAGVRPWLGHRRGWLLFRGLCGSLALFSIYAALARLPLATATLLQYLYPTLTALLAWRWLGEPIGRRVALALGLGWLGVGVLQTGSGGGAASEGVLLALAGALLTAVAYVSVRQLGRSEHPLVIVLWFPLMAVPLSLPLVLLEPVLPSPTELLWLLGVGLFTQLGQLGLTHGLTRLPAGRATALGYTQVAMAALWGWSVFGEPLAPQTLLGGALILAAAVLSRT